MVVIADLVVLMVMYEMLGTDPFRKLEGIRVIDLTVVLSDLACFDGKDFSVDRC